MNMCAASSQEIYLRSSALICGCFRLYSRPFAVITGQRRSAPIRPIAVSPIRRFGSLRSRFPI